MMKKKVKKIPKYNTGTPSVMEKISTGIGGGLDLYNQAISGQDVTVGTALKGGLSGFNAGMQIGGPIGGMIGAATGIIAGTAGRKHGYDKNSTSTNFNDIYKEGSGWLSWLGPSSHEAKSYANRIQSGNIAKIQTEEIKTDYMNNPNVQTQPILAAEGGIIPNDEIVVGVTAGEVYKDSNTGEWGIVKGKGMHSKKPKQDDAERMIIPKGSTIINKHKDYVYTEWGGRTGADIMQPLAKPIKTTGKYAEGTKAAIDAIGKKVLHKQELRKQELHLGEIKNKYSKGASYVQLGKDPIAKLEEELFKPQTPEITGKDRRRVYHLAKAGETMSDYLPMASALLKDYDYQRVQPRIGKNRNIPVDYNTNDVLVDNQLAHAINNYNISQMGGSTGAYLAAAGQSASNLAKANSKARIYQKNKQNELIARNITQLNDWERYANNQLWAADVATAQNQGMAQQMKDQAIVDGYEFYKGNKYDRWKLAMLEPMYQYGAPDEAYRQIYKRRTI